MTGDCPRYRQRKSVGASLNWQSWCDSYCTFNCEALLVCFPFSTKENFPWKGKFVKCDWPTQIFCWKKNFEVENLKWYFWEIFCPWKIFLSANGLFRVNMQVDYMIFKTSIISTWKPCHVTFETQHRLSEFILTLEYLIHYYKNVFDWMYLWWYFSWQQTKVAEYNELMTQWQNAQANCLKAITLQKKKVEAFKSSLNR